MRFGPMIRALPLCALLSTTLAPASAHAARRDRAELRLLLRDGRVICRPAVWRIEREGVLLEETASDALRMVRTDSILGAWNTGEPVKRKLFTLDGGFSGLALTLPVLSLAGAAYVAFRPNRGNPAAADPRLIGQPETEPRGRIWPVLAVGVATGWLVEAIWRTRRHSSWTWRGDLVARDAEGQPLFSRPELPACAAP